MEKRYTGVDEEAIVISQQFGDDPIGRLVENETQNDWEQFGALVN